MKQLDSIIQNLGLTNIDRGDPRTSRFGPRQVPDIHSQIHVSGQHSTQYHFSAQPHSRPDALFGYPNGCSCLEIALGSCSPEAVAQTPCWIATPRWPVGSREIARESIRRLCWSATTLAAGHVSYAAVSNTSPMNLFLANPANVSSMLASSSIASSDVEDFFSMRFSSPERVSHRRPCRVPISPPKTRYGHSTIEHFYYGTVACKFIKIRILPSTRGGNSVFTLGRKQKHSNELWKATRAI